MLDSRCGPLSLADALIAWSDPGLVDAVRHAEARVPADELLSLDRWRLDDLGSLRRPPRRFRMPCFGRPAVDTLDAAWDWLFGAFRLMVERGEVVLEGTPTIAFGPPARKRILRERAAEVVFDPPAGAVFLCLEGYVGVTAVRSAPGIERAAAGDLEAGRERGPGLSIRDALLAWAEPTLLERVRRLERLVADVNGRQLRFPRLFGRSLPASFDWSTTPPAEAMQPEASLAKAWTDLLADMRRRFEAGEWEVKGVQTFPLREAARAPIPGFWAAEFHFDVEANTIRVVQFNRTVQTYTAVEVRKVAGCPVSVSGDAEAVAQPVRPTRVDVREDNRQKEEPALLAGEGRRRAGRVAFPLELMVDIAVELGGEDWPNQGAAAYHLREAFKKKFPGVKPPAERTIFDHVAEIYRLRALRAAP